MNVLAECRFSDVALESAMSLMAVASDDANTKAYLDVVLGHVTDDGHWTESSMRWPCRSDVEPSTLADFVRHTSGLAIENAWARIQWLMAKSNDGSTDRGDIPHSALTELVSSHGCNVQ